MKDSIKKIKLPNGLHLYIPEDAPPYNFKTPQQIKEINKKLNSSVRIAQKKREFLKKALK